MKFLDTIKAKVWLIIYAPIYRCKYWLYRKERKKYKILNSLETISYITKNRCSVSRYGDGELAMVYHYQNKGTTQNFWINSFQEYNPELGRRLTEILVSSPTNNHKIGIPYAIISTNEYIGLERCFHERFVSLDIKRFHTILPQENSYLNAGFTRFYLYHRKIDFPAYISSLKKIWEQQDVIFIEGAHSRLGIGNDLFNNAKSIKRIICPATNAFNKYKQILHEVIKQSKDNLYLIALGHTATILAYDLAHYGYWALDIGHVDIEYEWFLKNAKMKIPIKNKYVNEIKDGQGISEISNPEYLSQIIVKIE